MNIEKEELIRRLKIAEPYNNKDVPQYVWSIINAMPSTECKGIPIEWLEEKLTNHPELPYAVTDGIIMVLELWETSCGARMIKGEKE